ncbi:Gfo/Idh/MocA family oxidoreductase [Cryptosporangium sp. NPDC051539]|uniref:Gfo/Idh/MocA family protein n=1 Tax=Cryptosporangium sp. NPDC051539 TaxID=3363962 RepID=UPI003791759D
MHALLRYFLDAADGRFPDVDGAVTTVPALARGAECAVAFTGHAVVATALSAGRLALERPDGFGGAMAPDFLRFLAGPAGHVGDLDVTMAGRGAGGPAALPVVTDADVAPGVPGRRIRSARQRGADPSAAATGLIVTMQTPVRFGLVGYGFGGRYFHAPLLRAARECELVGVRTSAPERRALVERELPGTPTVASLTDLVELGAEAVAISTPAGTHTALTEEALRLGLAVVCDKPFALDADAARATVELSRQLGLVLSPYQNRREDSDFRTVRALVDDGTLGTVTRLESRFERYAPEDGPGSAGGGTLLDFGSHLVDQALFLLGPVRGVYAELRERESGLDDDVFVALTHVSGARSHLWGSWGQFAPGPRWRVTGSAATYVVAAGDGQEEQLIAGAPAEVWGVEQAERFGRVYAGGSSSVRPTERGRWDTFYPRFAAAVRGEGPPPVEAADAIATAVVLDAARASVRTGTVVEVSAR